jgi:hypothetical protein
MAGRCTLHILLERLQLWLQAELASRDDPADRQAAYERHWELVYQVDEFNVRRYEAGRIGIQDRELSRYFRLEAELWLRNALRRSGKPVGLAQRPLPLPAWVQAPDERAIARAKFAVAQADPRQLARDKLAAAGRECAARWKLFLAGQGVQDVFLSACRRRLESQLALTDEKPVRLSAYKAYWRLMLQVEVVDRLRYEKARMSFQDYLQARHAFLDAEIQLARAQDTP